MGYRTMKYVRYLALALLLAVSPALAQWQVPQHSVPVGRGSGSQGFTNAAPGAAGKPLTSTGNSTDPAFGNVGINGGGTGLDNSGSATNDVLAYNGSGFFHTALSTLINSSCSLVPLTCTAAFGYAYAPWWGVKCDGVTDDGPAINTAIAAISGRRLLLQAGTCHVATKIALNTFTTTGALTVPGVKISGAGRLVTNLDTAVANDYMLAVNPALASMYKSLFVLTPSTSGGALAANTYFVNVTVTDGSANEIFGPLAKQVVVGGAGSGSIALTLPPIQSGYTYSVYIDTVNPPAHYATIAAADAHGLAAGSYTITAVGGAHAVPTNKVAVWQEAELSDLSITNSAATANASGVLWFKVGYSFMRNVYLKGLTGDGVGMPNWSGDSDGWFDVTFDNVKWDNVSGWCLNGAGNTLENSNLTVINSFFNLCGTVPPINAFFNPTSITAITNANPGIVTSATSNFNWTVGDYVWVQGITGMALGPGNFRACAPVTANSFALCDANGNNVNTTALGAYAGSGVVQLTFRPPQMQVNGNGPTMSGAIAYTGLIANFKNIGFTQNKNTNFYFTEAGSNDNITLEAVDMENTYGVGLYAAAGINLSWKNGECLSTTASGPTTFCMIFGTGINKGGMINATIDGIKVRSDVTNVATGFAQLQGASGQINPQTFSVRNVYWQAFTGTKFLGFSGNPYPFFWARVDGKTGAACTLKDSFNVTSCIRNGAGDYTFTFITPQLDANYTISGAAQQTGTGPGVVGVANSANLTTSAARVGCYVTNAVATLQDCDVFSVVGFGNPF